MDAHSAQRNMAADAAALRRESPACRTLCYNGTAGQPERQSYRLSDLFCREETEPGLELKVTVLNINPGYNRELLEKCESLSGYTTFVEKARNKRGFGMKAEEAVRQAVDECISEGILAEFFKENREEIVEMGIYEFNQEVYDEVLREDGEARGIEIGRRQDIESLMDTLKLTAEQAMDALKIPTADRNTFMEKLRIKQEEEK